MREYPVITDIFLDERREKRAARDIRASLAALTKEERNQIRRGQALVIMPMGVKRDKAGDIFLVPGRVTVHVSDKFVPMGPHERRALVPYERISDAEKCLPLVREMELAMIADIEAAQLKWWEEQEKMADQLMAMLPKDTEEETDADAS